MAKKEVKRFLFNCEWKDIIKDLSGNSRLKVYEAIIDYADTGALPKLNPMEKLAFDFICKEVDWNGDKYEEIRKHRSEAGKRGNEVRWKKNVSQSIANIANATFATNDIANIANNRKVSQTSLNVNVNDNVLSNDNIKENVLTDMKEKTDAEDKEKPKRVIFVKPTIEQVKERMQEMGYTGFTAEAFWNFYESKGWMVGANHMKNWKAALVTWNSQRRQRGRGDQTHDRMHYEGEHNPHAYDEAEEIAKWQAENEL